MLQMPPINPYQKAVFKHLKRSLFAIKHFSTYYLKRLFSRHPTVCHKKGNTLCHFQSGEGDDLRKTLWKMTKELQSDMTTKTLLVVSLSSSHSFITDSPGKIWNSLISTLLNGKRQRAVELSCLHFQSKNPIWRKMQLCLFENSKINVCCRSKNVFVRVLCSLLCLIHFDSCYHNLRI